MANQFTTIKGSSGIVAKAAAKLLSDELQFCKSIGRADESDYDGKNGFSAGDTIYINIPARFKPQQTFDITSSMQDVVEQKVPLVLDTISTIGINVNSLEFATQIQLKSCIERIVKPAVQAIAQDVEGRFLVKAKNMVYNSVGVTGSTVYDTDTILASRERLNKFLAPKDSNRFLLIDSTAMRSAIGARKGLFNDQEALAKQYKTGVIGRADNYAWLENELLPTHTRGTQTGAFTVTNTVTVEGQATLNLTGLANGTLFIGDVISVANVNAVHPIQKKVYTFNQQFVVTANNTASAGGAYTNVPVQPMYTAASGGLQNIDAMPQAGAAVTIVGAAGQSSTQNLAFHKNAFRMVSVPLVMPKAVEWAVQETYQGISVAIIRAFDPLQRRMITRMDFLGGIVAERPEWACRIPA